MEPNRDTNVDPDYEKYNLALKEIQGKERQDELTSERLYNIIAEEFDTELTLRQQQLEEIEEKIFKAQKLLHLVRYVLIASYYNKRNLEYASTNEDSSSIFDAQNRLHPAVKKLLGSNNSFDILSVRGKRKVHNKNIVNNEAGEDCHPPNVKKVKLKETTSDNLKCSVSVSQNSLKRKKTKHRILIGNISKWMPSLENDNTTHKWMVYVRGTKEAPDLSHLIEKVVFYLHPSYKPHDIVEVNEYPFHLSRRGWGEFPLRVQIFFKCALNKPVSIVHNLKLDKTYTGRQTLGNETIVDIFLYDDVSVKLEPETLPGCSQTILTDNEHGASNDYNSSVKSEIRVQETLKNENIDAGVINNIKEECDESSDGELELSGSSSFEHNYCHDKKPLKDEDATVDVSTDMDIFLTDHNYSLPYSDYINSLKRQEGIAERQTDTKKQGENKLVFGLDNSYEDNTCKLGADLSKNKCFITTLTTASGQPIRVLPQSFNKVLLTNGSVVQIRVLKTPQSLLKNVDADGVRQKLPNAPENRTDPDEYRVTFPEKLFKNVGEVLPYLLKRLPLWSDHANNVAFKRCYPYVAKSAGEFSSWNIGKQLNSEWNRAKTVKQVLHSKDFPELHRWSTKAIFMYARSHGYSPLRPKGNAFKRPSDEAELISTCFSESSQKRLTQDPVNSDMNVDVTEDNVSSSTSRDFDVTDISDGSLRHQCAFVKEAALDCGVVLKSERIAEGMVWNGAERMMLEAVKCLAEHLVRRATHHLVCQEGVSETTDVGVDEIKIAMNDRPEIKSIGEYQKRRLVKDFFS